MTRKAFSASGQPARILAAAALMAAMPAWAGFTDNGDGTVTDTDTGLMWQRCLVAQTWDGHSCTGTPELMPFVFAFTHQSFFAGYSDWRLPNIRELNTLVDLNAVYPAMDSGIFPNNQDLSLWSSTLYHGSDHEAWYLRVAFGEIMHAEDKNPAAVRMVRGATPPQLNTARPSSDYVDNYDGTVTHIPTGLMWYRCNYGQTFKEMGALGYECEGEIEYENLGGGALDPVTGEYIDSSPIAGHSDWRMPSRDELMSLIDYDTEDSPAVNRKMFPATRKSLYWSSTNTSAQDGKDNQGWSVDFGTGEVAIHPAQHFVYEDPTLGGYQWEDVWYPAYLVRNGNAAPRAAGFQASQAYASGGRMNLSGSWRIADSDKGQTGNYYAARSDGKTLYFLTPDGWQAWSGGPLPILETGVLRDKQITLLDYADVSQWVGQVFFIGYGRDEADLLSGKFGAIYTFPAP